MKEVSLIVIHREEKIHNNIKYFTISSFFSHSNIFIK